MLGRGVEVQHERHVVDVDATRRDVGRDDDLGVARGEPGEVALTLALVEVAVQVDGLDARERELLRDACGAATGAGEDDRAGRVGQQVAHDLQLLGAIRDHDVVRHLALLHERLGHVVQHVLGQVALDELVDVTVERGGQQQALGLARRGRQERVDRLVEAEVAQVVGLVEHDDLEVVERHGAAVDQVGEPARRGDDEVDTVTQACGLTTDRHATEHRHGAQVEGLGHAGEVALDLGGELAGGHQDQAAGRLRAALAAGEGVEDGDAERQGLAGAGAGAAEHVRAGQGRRDDDLLDRGGLDDALASERLHERLGQPVGGEAGGGGQGGRGRRSVDRCGVHVSLRRVRAPARDKTSRCRWCFGARETVSTIASTQGSALD